MDTENLPTVEGQSSTPPEAKFRFVHDPQKATVNFFEEHGLEFGRGYTKAELRQMGWAFYNRVGDGQVPIIKQIDGENTRMDALLTPEQLERHKKESLPEGITEQDLPAIEDDMNKFMRRVQSLTYITENLTPESRGGAIMQNYINRFISETEDAHPELVPKIEEKLKEADFYRSDIPDEIVAGAMKTVKDKHEVPDNVRGIPVNQLARRGEGRGVFGHPCPCMDCEHEFPATDGIKIFDEDGLITGMKGQIRMNVITSHLAGHGINNNENQTVDRDHRYMTLREYLPIYEKRQLDEESPTKLPNPIF